MKDWQRFVIAHGWRARHSDLSAVTGQSVDDIDRLRATGACSKLKEHKRFAELFTLWHGRPPRDVDWSRPRKCHRGGHYEWQAPELALLATLVGTLGKLEIAAILTERLRKITGDRTAERSPNSTQIAMNRIGMLTTDIVGGITAAEAGREINAYAIVFQSIQKGELKARKIGRALVITHEAWAAWKAKRVFPPKGFIQLASLKQPLGIRSDKLSEWARLGYVPTALRCNPYGTRTKSTAFGSWWIDKKVATKLVADRRAGRQMPWWGKPEPCNLKVTWTLLQARRHPASCKTCAHIWGPKGAPLEYADYANRYPPLEHGAKRHLTRKWSPGLTIAEVAKLTKHSWSGVRLAIANKMLPATLVGRCHYITRTDATRWNARRCPCGTHEKSWLSIDTAAEQYAFTVKQLLAFIDAGQLRSKIGTNGPMCGVKYVLRFQCSHLREKIGFTEAQAARRVGVSIARLRNLLEGVNWRGAERIPLDTVQAVSKRKYSQDTGYTIEEAAAKLRMPVEWIHDRKLDGTIRIMRGKFDRRRLYVSQPMFERLKAAKASPATRESLGADWLYLSQAAKEAGVCTATIIRWADDGELKHRPSPAGTRYHRKRCRARARRYWKTVRFHRATPPEWLRQELQA